MSNQSVSDALARMASDETFAQAVRKNARKALAGYDLTDDEQRALATMTTEAAGRAPSALGQRLSKSSLFGMSGAGAGAATPSADPGVVGDDAQPGGDGSTAGGNGEAGVDDQTVDSAPIVPVDASMVDAPTSDMADAANTGTVGDGGGSEWTSLIDTSSGDTGNGGGTGGDVSAAGTVVADPSTADVDPSTGGSVVGGDVMQSPDGPVGQTSAQTDDPWQSLLHIGSAPDATAPGQSGDATSTDATSTDTTSTDTTSIDPQTGQPADLTPTDGTALSSDRDGAVDPSTASVPVGSTAASTDATGTDKQPLEAASTAQPVDGAPTHGTGTTDATGHTDTIGNTLTDQQTQDGGGGGQQPTDQQSTDQQSTDQASSTTQTNPDGTSTTSWTDSQGNKWDVHFGTDNNQSSYTVTHPDGSVEQHKPDGTWLSTTVPHPDGSGPAASLPNSHSTPVWDATTHGWRDSYTGLTSSDGTHWHSDYMDNKHSEDVTSVSDKPTTDSLGKQGSVSYHAALNQWVDYQTNAHWDDKAQHWMISTTAHPGGEPVQDRPQADPYGHAGGSVTYNQSANSWYDPNARAYWDDKTHQWLSSDDATHGQPFVVNKAPMPAANPDGTIFGSYHVSHYDAKSGEWVDDWTGAHYHNQGGSWYDPGTKHLYTPGQLERDKYPELPDKYAPGGPGGSTGDGWHAVYDPYNKQWYDPTTHATWDPSKHVWNDPPAKPAPASPGDVRP
ncbi:MAG: hypothetical protein E6J14_14965 [Chloroflexi bacterium]|nr:MAG: hypothetical protein E6J14_14965 [Chloroflexota bacterium]